jgi:nitrate/nitrite transporter NarK
MDYVLPRAIFLLIAWGLTCLLVRHLWPAADATVFGAAGACWAVGGFAYFGYLRKLRREIDELERNRRYGVVPSTAQQPLSSAE